MGDRLRAALRPYALALLVGGPIALIISAQLADAARVSSIRWAHPWAVLLLGGPVLVAWARFHLRRRRAATLAHPRVAALARIQPGALAGYALELPEVLRVLALALVAAALMRPQTYRVEEVEVESMDLMIVLDLSRSMEERDLRYNRLDAGQRTIRRFLKDMPSDRVGLVVFAQEAMLRAPLTLDHRALDSIVADLAIGDVPERGTAIGDALALSLAVLRRSDARSKVVLLLSDGESNYTTEFAPEQARDLAVDMRVKVFTVLLGRPPGQPGLRLGGRHPVNPRLLREIADATGGAFFHAHDDEALGQSFRSVREELELTRRRTRAGVLDSDLYTWLLWPALVLLGLEWLMRMTRWRRFP